MTHFVKYPVELPFCKVLKRNQQSFSVSPLHGLLSSFCVSYKATRDNCRCVCRGTQVHRRSNGSFSDCASVSLAWALACSASFLRGWRSFSDKGMKAGVTGIPLPAPALSCLRWLALHLGVHICSDI